METHRGIDLAAHTGQAPASTEGVGTSASIDSPNVRAVETTATAGHAQYLGGFKLVAIMSALCLSNFLVALDTTILSTAIPAISDNFRSLPDVGWYISAYLLTNCAFQLIYGKLYTLYDVKTIFLIAMVVFEIGSLICALAPNSPVFIFARAVAGLGGAGTFNGALIAIIHVVEPAKRAGFSGMIVGMYGIASIAGPLIGGAFTSRVTWRWCFYINLPVGGVALVAILLFLRTPRHDTVAQPGHSSNSLLWTRVAKFDPLGSACLLVSIICLLLALQMGGTTYEWSNGRVIGLFVVFGVLLIAFVSVQLLSKPDNATIPPGVLKQRSVAFGSLYMFLVGAHFFIFVYFLPIWFQGVRGMTALESGVATLPILLAQTIFVVLGGITVSITGYYMPLIYLSVILTSIGGGLLTTLDRESSTGKWIAYQIVYGIGGGMGYQQGITAAQAVLGPAEVAIGTALMVFVQNFGGTIFVSAANNVFVTQLVRNMAASIPDLDPRLIISAGATGIRGAVSETDLPLVLAAYNDAVVMVFRIGLIMACACLLGALGMEWRKAPTGKEAVSSKNSEEAGAKQGQNAQNEKDPN